MQEKQAAFFSQDATRKAAEEGIPSQDEDYELPEKDYLGKRACAARSSQRALHSITIKRIGEPDQFIEYYGVDGTAENEELEFITGAHRLWLVKVTGLNLKRLSDYIKEHRLSWIREAERDSYEDKQLYIKKISVTHLPFSDKRVTGEERPPA